MLVDSSLLRLLCVHKFSSDQTTSGGKEAKLILQVGDVSGDKR